MALQNSVSNPTPVVVSKGGTGLSTLNTFQLLASGTTSTGNLQQIAAGTAGQVLTSAGVGALPTFSTFTGSTTFTDAAFQIQNSVNLTKVLKFSAVSITTGTTRTITMADANINLSLSGGSYQANLSGASLTAVTVATTDKVLIQDTSDSNNLKTVTAQSIANLAPSGIPTWQSASLAQALVKNIVYMAEDGFAVTVFTLPVTAAVGDTFRIYNSGSSFGFRVAQNAAQRIEFLDVNTTIGITGKLETIAGQQDQFITIACVTTNSTFAVIQAVGQFDLT